MPRVKERLRDIAPLLTLVALDACLKIAAFHLLARNEHIERSQYLQVALRVNSSGLGSLGKAAFPGGAGVILWQAAFAMAAVAATLILVRRTRRGTLFVILACLAATFAGSQVAHWLAAPLGQLGAASAVVAMRAAQAVFWVTSWSLARSRWWRLGFLLMAAAAMGNLLSHFYPPFAVVDFLYSAPISRVAGFGVFNLADLVWLAAIPVLLFAAARTIYNLATDRSAYGPIDDEVDDESDGTAAESGEPHPDAKEQTE